jgi:hypothetical protein
MLVGREISAQRGDIEIDVPGGVQAHQGQVPPPGEAWQRDFFRLVFHTDLVCLMTAPVPDRTCGGQPLAVDGDVQNAIIRWSYLNREPPLGALN